MADIAGTPVSAHDVAAEIRERLPGVPGKKLHKLLYYCQGHHVGTFGVPLFTEAVSAWDMGPVVGELWFRETHQVPPPARRQLTEAQLNTIGYVLSRYGGMTGRDLEILSHSESPWQRADAHRLPKQRARIELEWLRDHFVGNVEEDEVPLDSQAVADWLAAAEPPPEPGEPGDDSDRLLAMRAELTARATRAG